MKSNPLNRIRLFLASVLVMARAISSDMVAAHPALGPVEGALTILIVGVLFAIGPFVFGSLQIGLNTDGLPAAAKKSFGNVFVQIYNAWGILPVALVVLALVVIISIVFLLVPRRAGGGGMGGGEAV